MCVQKTQYLTPIVKIVGDFCNNRCGYCFYNNLDQISPHRMSLKMLESFIRQHAELVEGDIVFIWHGGEPLLAGIGFFREIIRLQKKHIEPSRIVRNSIQTNATLINEKWGSFFEEHSFSVGVSLDGDKKSHDLFRVSSTGRGTFDRTIRGIEMLRKHGIEPRVIQTVTSATAGNAYEDFAFFVDVLGLHNFSINEYADIDGLNAHMIGQSLSNDDFARLIIQHIDLWLERDNEMLRIREIDNFMTGPCNGMPKKCSFSGMCATLFYAVNYDGKVYPCDRLSGRADMCFGSIAEQPLGEILFGERRQKYANMVKAPNPDCTDCEWTRVCNNGCTSQRIGGIDGKFYYCEARKAVFTYLRDKVSAVIGKDSTKAVA